MSEAEALAFAEEYWDFMDAREQEYRLGAHEPEHGLEVPDSAYSFDCSGMFE